MPASLKTMLFKTHLLRTLPAFCIGFAALLTLPACGGGSGSSASSPPPPPPSDTSAPSLSFDPATLRVVSGETGASTLTATDNVGITTGPTTTCTNGGSFANNVFTAPDVTENTTSICTVTAGDAAGNSGTATLTVTVTRKTSNFFRITSDVITTDPVLGMANLGTDPATLVGLTKTAAGSVSSFTAPRLSLGVFDDPAFTALPTLGTVGPAPLDIFFADIDGVEENAIPDLLFFDSNNDALVALPLEADGSFRAPITRSVPNGCAAGPGSQARFGRVIDPKTTRDDVIIGTPTDIFYVASGDADEMGSTGLAAPILIASGGDFCSLHVSGYQGRTTYTVYNAATRIITSFGSPNGDTASYRQDYSSNLSSRVTADQTLKLFDGIMGPFGLASLYSVFDTPEGGSKVIRSAVRGSQAISEIDIDMSTPADMLIFYQGNLEQLVLVSPTEEYAIYIRNAATPGRSIQLIDIGLGFDQVSVAGNSLAFASSTQGNIIIRKPE